MPCVNCWCFKLFICCLLSSLNRHYMSNEAEASRLSHGTALLCHIRHATTLVCHIVDVCCRPASRPVLQMTKKKTVLSPSRLAYVYVYCICTCIHIHKQKYTHTHRLVKSQELSVRCLRPPSSRGIAPLLLTLSRETSGADLSITQKKNADQELVL